MKKSSRTALKSFLKKSPELEKFLSEKERKLLKDTFVPEKLFFEESDLLDKVHWSWFLPTLKAYSEEEQQLFLGALNPYAVKNLTSTLDLLKTETELPEVGRKFLRQVLLDSLIDRKDPPLPIESLPESPLNKLLALPKKKLVRLIDLLALHDLAEDLRQIVETKILKKIYSFLTDEEGKLLKKAGAHREAFSLGKLNLERWDGSEESLRTPLHKRGLMRLGSALSGQYSDLLWHLCHQLDIGRGTTLFKLAKKPSPQPVQEALLRQIEELL